MLSNQIKKFVENNIKLIEDRKFDELYDKILTSGQDRRKFTEFLLTIGINPINFFNNKIPAYSYAGIESIKHVVIPSNIDNIDHGAFSACDNLETVEIPEGVTHLGARCFYYCSKLTTVIYKGTAEEFLNIKKILNPFQGSPVDKIICKDKTIDWDY